MCVSFYTILSCIDSCSHHRNQHAEVSHHPKHLLYSALRVTRAPPCHPSTGSHPSVLCLYNLSFQDFPNVSFHVFPYLYIAITWLFYFKLLKMKRPRKPTPKKKKKVPFVYAPILIITEVLVKSISRVYTVREDKYIHREATFCKLGISAFLY